jgi:hypothetical protein
VYSLRPLDYLLLFVPALAATAYQNLGFEIFEKMLFGSSARAMMRNNNHIAPAAIIQM